MDGSARGAGQQHTCHISGPQKAFLNVFQKFGKDPNDAGAVRRCIKHVIMAHQLMTFRARKGHEEREEHEKPEEHEEREEHRHQQHRYQQRSSAKRNSVKKRLPNWLQQ